MSLLIDDKKLINLKFHYIETPDKYVSRFKFIQSQEEYEKNKDDPNMKELNTGWRAITWSDHNHIYSPCLKYTTSSEGVDSSNLDFIKYRDMKLKACLRQWDIKDETDRPVPVSDTTIDHLHPDVANELLNGFEKVTENTEQTGDS